MTISGVSSATNGSQPVVQDGFAQAFQDFQGIESAIESGDLATAQTALTTFQQDLQSGAQNNPLSRLFSKNSALGQDLQTLQTALTSNDPAAAKSAFGSLIQDMQSAMKTHGHHRHHHHHVKKASDGDADDNAQSSTGSTSAGSGTTASTGSTDSTTSSGSLVATIDISVSLDVLA